MINIKFPDGAVRQYEAGISADGIAKSISEGLARKVLAASVNGEVWDSTRPIHTDASLQLLTWDDDAGKKYFLAFFCPLNGRGSGGIVSGC